MVVYNSSEIAIIQCFWGRKEYDFWYLLCLPEYPIRPVWNTGFWAYLGDLQEILISRILPYFYIISRENGVKMGYDIYLTMYNREFHTVNAWYCQLNILNIWISPCTCITTGMWAYYYKKETSNKSNSKEWYKTVSCMQNWN